MLLKNSKQSIMNVGLFPLIGQYLNQLVKLTSNLLWLIVVFLFGPRDKDESLDHFDKLYLNVTIWSAIGTGILAIIAFVGNFNLIADLAYKHGIPYPMAYLIPLALDGFVVISILIVLGAALVGQKAGLIKFLVFMSSLTGIYFNVSHVITTGELALMSLLLHSVLGAMLYLAVEVTAHQITNYIRRKSFLRTNEVLQLEIDNLISRRDMLKIEIEAEKASLMAQIDLDMEHSKQQLAEIKAHIKSAKKSNFSIEHIKTAFSLGKNPSSTGQQIAEIVGKGSATTGNALKREIKTVLNGELVK